MIVVLSGHPRPRSRTLGLAQQVGAALATQRRQAQPTMVDVAVLGARLLVPGDAEVAAAVGLIRSAAVLVIATPTYKGSYTGALKVLLDELPQRGLDGVPAVPVITAGIIEQAQATEGHLRALLDELGATTVPASLLVTNDGLDQPEPIARAYAETVAAGLAAPTPG
jgi:FMN reductase